MILVKNSVTGEWEQVAGNFIGNANAPIGAIFPFGGTSAPSGYLMCDGSAVSRSDYSALFAVIGTSFGAGDGSTTFNVPDLRESVPVGAGTRASGVSAHDTYSVGTFKDDQVQDHRHYRYSERRQGWSIGAEDQGSTSYGNVATNSTNYSNAIPVGYVYDGRTGTTTHGKQLGVNYIIKAKDVNLSGGGQTLADRVSALETVNSITITPNASIISQNETHVLWTRANKQGNVVCVEVAGFILSDITTGTDLFSGLPGPLGGQAYHFSIRTTRGNEFMMQPVVLNTEGKLRTSGNATFQANDEILGMFTYISAT